MLQWILLVCRPELHQWHSAPNTQLPYALAANCSKLTIFQKNALLRKEANEPRSLCTVPSLDWAPANDWHRKATFTQGRANSVMSFVVHGSQWDKADISLLLRTCLCLVFSPCPFLLPLCPYLDCMFIYRGVLMVFIGAFPPRAIYFNNLPQHLVLWRL